MKSEWQQRNAARCSCRGSDEYCPCQNDERLFEPKTLADQLAEAEAKVETIKRAIRQGPCAQHGHDWKSEGGCNAGCDRDDDCGCSVPVNVCTKCGDCDYGDNDEAEAARADCRIKRGETA